MRTACPSIPVSLRSKLTSAPFPLADDEDNLAAHARKNAQDAMLADRAKAAAFDKAAAEERKRNEAAANGGSMDSASAFLARFRCARVH